MRASQFTKKEDNNKYKYSICINDLDYEGFEKIINDHLNVELKKKFRSCNCQDIY